jgi:hypothetical protein
MRKIAWLSVLLLMGACGKDVSVETPARDSSDHVEITPGGTPSPYRNAEEAEVAVQKALQGDGAAAWGLTLYFLERGDSVRARAPTCG